MMASPMRVVAATLIARRRGGATCGDGTTCPELEFCDDGFTDACGSCNADCSAAGAGAVCGDGEACPEPEFCDDGYTDACGSCNADCSAAGSAPICGDGTLCPNSSSVMMGIPTAATGVMEIVPAPIMSVVTRFSSVQRPATTVMQLMTEMVVQHFASGKVAVVMVSFSHSLRSAMMVSRMPVVAVTLIAPVSVPGQSAAMVRLVRN